MTKSFVRFSACYVFLFIGLYAADLSWVDWDGEAVALVRGMMDTRGIMTVLSWVVAMPRGGWWLTWYPLAAVVSFGFCLWYLHMFLDGSKVEDNV